MSNSNGINTLDRSINGIITYSDGSGTLIQNGKIITITLTANIINAINFIISNIGCNGILTIGSAATTEIKIIPTANLTLGSATSKDTLIQNSDGVIMGQTPASYNPVTGLMNAPGMRFENKSGSSFLDFHSNTVGSGETDSRIISTGGTATALNGSLAMTSGTIFLSATDTTNISNLTTNINSSTKIELVSPLINLNATVVKVNYILPLTLNGIIKLGDITQGSSQIDYCVYIQGKRNALSYYKAASGQTYPTFVESVSNGIVAGFDFHTSGNNEIDYDARIECGSAITGSTTGTAIMSIVARAVKMDNILPYTTNGPILLGEKTLINYGARLQGTNSALSYYQAAAQTYPTFVNTVCDGSTSYLQFHNNGLSNVNYDTQIVSEFGSSGAVDGTGTLRFNASVINMNTLAAININPVGNLNIGTSTSATTRIRCTDALVIGNNPATYSAGLMTAPGLAMRHSTGAASIEFYSNIVNSTNSDSKIISSFGTASPRSGTLDIQSGTVNISGVTAIYLDAPSITATTPGQFLTLGNSSSIQGSAYSSLYCNNGGSGGCYVNAFPTLLLLSSTTTGGTAQCDLPFILNGGLRFNKGTFFNGGTMFSAGGYVYPNNLGANNAVTVSIPFNMTFGAGSVYLSVYGYSIDAASMGVISSFQGTTTTQFVANFYNARSVTAPGGTFGINYIAIGYN